MVSRRAAKAKEDPDQGVDAILDVLDDADQRVSQSTLAKRRRWRRVLEIRPHRDSGQVDASR